MNDNRSDKMTNQEQEEATKALLKREFASMQNEELRRDLWPEMLRGLDAQLVRVPWFDWALAAATIAVLLLFPGAIPALLYQL